MDDFSEDLVRIASEVDVQIYKFPEIERRGRELEDRPMIEVYFKFQQQLLSIFYYYIVLYMSVLNVVLYIS